MPAFSFASTVVSLPDARRLPDPALRRWSCSSSTATSTASSSRPGEGGGPILYQHLTWIFLTAAYTAIVVFAAGVISEIVTAFSAKPSFSHRSTLVALAAAGVFGPLAWMQNMYTADMARGWMYFGMLFALALMVPLGVLFFNWIGTLWNGALRLRAPLIFALGAISTLSFGLAGELAQSVIPVGWQLANTMAAWQDTHYALIGGAVFGGFAALYYWFPKMTGRTMGEGLGIGSFVALLVGVHLMCLPMFFAGLEGQPVDAFKYYSDTGLSFFNLLASIGSFVLAIGIVLTLVNAVVSIRSGARAGHDPWGGSTLEWFALSPPPDAQLRRRPRRPLGRAAARHPRGRPPPDRGVHAAAAAGAGRGRGEPAEEPTDGGNAPVS